MELVPVLVVGELLVEDQLVDKAPLVLLTLLLVLLLVPLVTLLTLATELLLTMLRSFGW